MLDFYTGFFMILVVMILGFIAWGTSAIAMTKGYNASWWMLFGWLFGIVALLIIMCLPSKSNPGLWWAKAVNGKFAVPNNWDYVIIKKNPEGDK